MQERDVSMRLKRDCIKGKICTLWYQWFVTDNEWKIRAIKKKDLVWLLFTRDQLTQKFKFYISKKGQYCYPSDSNDIQWLNLDLSGTVVVFCIISSDFIKLDFNYNIDDGCWFLIRSRFGKGFFAPIILVLNQVFQVLCKTI